MRVLEGDGDPPRLVARCGHHPQYTGKRPPKIVHCGTCLRIFREEDRRRETGKPSLTTVGVKS